jgi:uncharacterized protein (DUF1800 family)
MIPWFNQKQSKVETHNMTMLTALDARHLLTRTGFTPSEAEVQQIAGLSREAAIKKLLESAKSNQPKETIPAFVNAPHPTPPRDLKTQEERQDQRRTQIREGLDLKLWWLWEMLTTPHPLAERMTLFWHNHFATSQQKVVRSQIMWQQHLLLRNQALGSFAKLLHGIVRDPAMLIYLDNANNRKDAPNENFGRELLELFSLGEAGAGGGYTERDIKEAARALTGFSIEPETGEFVLRPRIQDTSSKTILGKTGNFDADSLVDVLLAQPQTARHIVRKLWLEFISPTPKETVVNRIAIDFAQSGYDITTALRALLLSDDFWASYNRGALIKSPLDLLVGAARQFQFSVSDPQQLLNRTAQLGQNLLMPPNVKGWPGGTQWINATTLLERKRTTEQMFTQGIGMKYDTERWLSSYGARPDSVPDDTAKDNIHAAMLALPPAQAVPAGTVGAAYVRALTLDPVFQLK